jgi:palmitoyl-protein thioesterase
MQSIAEFAEQINPGTFVYAIRLDDSSNNDKRATFIGDMNDEVAKVCADLAAHPILSTAPAINAMGFSQGGQFLRAYVERCNNPPVANLVTFGSQHNGIAEFQTCKSNDWLCRGWEGILKSQTWSNFVQTQLVPAQYYRDPVDLDSYLQYSNFLADINNERSVKNQTYVENVKKLEKFVMYIFEDDETVVPKWSGWFSEYNATSGEQTRLQDRELYKQDWLGLKWLDENHRLEFRQTGGKHMRLSDEVLEDAFQKYFSKRVNVEDPEHPDGLSW